MSNISLLVMLLTLFAGMQAGINYEDKKLTQIRIKL